MNALIKSSVRNCQTLLLVAVASLFSQNLLVGPPEVVHTYSHDPYGDIETLPPNISKDEAVTEQWPADAVIATLKIDESTMRFFCPFPNRIDVYEGSLLDVFSKAAYLPPEKPTPTSPYQYAYPHIAGMPHIPFNTDPGSTLSTRYITESNGFNNGDLFQGDIGMVWLKNIYKVPNSQNDKELIGFLHIESLNPNLNPLQYPVRYSIGLAYSNDLVIHGRYSEKLLNQEIQYQFKQLEILQVPPISLKMILFMFILRKRYVQVLFPLRTIRMLS